jgi:hypothetical protein
MDGSPRVNGCWGHAIVNGCAIANGYGPALNFSGSLSPSIPYRLHRDAIQGGRYVCADISFCVSVYFFIAINGKPVYDLSQFSA